ncbi:MAG TPA: aminopeptidase [Candidatus Polarisedimenticolia bacterium]|nr:aminopeptidase [Candidatus Polarisedimenticolia bacterium]
MKDPRVDRLARLLVGHSCALKEGERVVIEAIGAPVEPVLALVREVKRRGATPLVWLKDDRVIRELAALADEADVRFQADSELAALRQAQAMISLRAVHNAHEYGEVPPGNLARVLEGYVRPVHYEHRNRHLRWVALRWPTPGQAQRAGMGTGAYEDFFFEVCLVDYARMERDMQPLLALLARTDRVRVEGPGDTDLRFSIKGIGARASAGRHNLPDGEVFTAPVRDSVEGRIAFNVRSTYYGATFSDVRLTFRRGRIVEAAADEARRLAAILDQDEGARFLGEFALGVNPAITRPVGDLLFDEKMTGSLHVAAGNAYDECDNGNRSAIHWDLILMQTADRGGGNVWFDDRLVRRDGLFVPEELQGLNPGASAGPERSAARS